MRAIRDVAEEAGGRDKKRLKEDGIDREKWRGAANDIGRSTRRTWSFL